MLNPDLSSTHEAPPVTTSVAPWTKAGAPTVQALPMAMLVHPASGAAHPLVQAIHHLLSGGQHVNPGAPENTYGVPIGGTTATAPGVGARTVNPPNVTQRTQTTGPSSPTRPAFDGRVHYYP